MSRPVIIGIGIVVVVIVGVCLFYLLKPSAAGDGSKLDIERTAAEQQLIDTVKVSRQRLEAADGSGEECLVAVNGVVYDVSGSRGWKDGKHHGLQAGRDLTQEFVKSHHGKAVLKKMRVVGSLEE